MICPHSSGDMQNTSTRKQSPTGRWHLTFVKLKGGKCNYLLFSFILNYYRLELFFVWQYSKGSMCSYLLFSFILYYMYNRLNYFLQYKIGNLNKWILKFKIFYNDMLIFWQYCWNWNWEYAFTVYFFSLFTCIY